MKKYEEKKLLKCPLCEKKSLKLVVDGDLGRERTDFGNLLAPKNEIFSCEHCPEILLEYHDIYYFKCLDNYLDTFK